jgi:hypothetical protein
MLASQTAVQQGAGSFASRQNPKVQIIYTTARELAQPTLLSQPCSANLAARCSSTSTANQACPVPEGLAQQHHQAKGRPTQQQLSRRPEIHTQGIQVLPQRQRPHLRLAVSSDLSGGVAAAAATGSSSSNRQQQQQPAAAAATGSSSSSRPPGQAVCHHPGRANSFIIQESNKAQSSIRQSAQAPEGHLLKAEHDQHVPDQHKLSVSMITKARKFNKYVLLT